MALKATRDKVKRLEQTISRKNKRIEELETENNQLKKENEKLKNELKTLRKALEWAKPNTNRGKDGKKKKKKGPKKGHAPNKRKLPDQEPDQTIEITPLVCQTCDHLLPKPGQFHTHTQIDIPEGAPPIVTEFHVGWAWCSCCSKYVSCNDKLANTKYGPRLYAYAAYLKYDVGLTYGKISSTEKYRHHDLNRLAKRMHKHRRALYLFIKSGIDPTNNFGERDIRPTVLMRKTSYGNRSESGAETQSIIMSLARTHKKQKMDFVEQVTEHLESMH